jgi:peptidyl-prolyl cis-trans isomerase SurA
LPISDPNSLTKRDSLFNLIKHGEDFDSLAKSHSSSYNEKTGCTSIISKGVFPKDFENQIFKIKKGEIEKLNSPMGYYIVRCEDNSLNMELDSTTKEEIKNKISKNDRADNISLQLVERYKNKYGFEFYPNALNLFVDAMTQTKQHIDVLLMKQNDPLFMLGGETFSQEDFKTVFSNNLWKFSIIKNGQSERAMAPELDVNSSEKDFVYFIFNNYVKSCIMDREYDWLYKNNPEYRNLLNEYKDGLLLFDISQREVWGKSARDAVKLTEFFEANKEKYSFSEPKFRGSIIYCKNEKIKKKAEKLLAKGMSAEDVVNELKEDFKKEEKPAYLKVGLFAKGNNEAVDANIFKSAEYKNEKYPFVVLTGSLTNTPENYREVKGPVTADYQNQLEIEWVKSLREKYPVVINQDVLDSIKNK